MNSEPYNIQHKTMKKDKRSGVSTPPQINIGNNQSSGKNEKNGFIDNILSGCLKFTKKKEFKDEVTKLITPFISIILKEIYPYIFFTLLFAISSFIITICILIIMLRKYYVINKIGI